MVDFGSIAKKAQDALSGSAEKIEAALKDNAGKIEGAVDKAGQFAKEKFPDRAAQIDSAAGKAKAAVPRHEDATGAAVDPVTPSHTTPSNSTPSHSTPTHTVPDTTAPAWAPPSSTPVTPTSTPDVDTTQPSSAGFAPPVSPTPEVDRIAREQG